MIEECPREHVKPIYGFNPQIRPSSKQCMRGHKKAHDHPMNTERVDVEKISALGKPQLKSVHDISFQDLDKFFPDESNSKLMSPREDKQLEDVALKGLEQKDYYAFGNASEVGFRKGEQKVLYEGTMDELTGHQKAMDVSIIYKMQNREFESQHMKIIESHQQEVIEDAGDSSSRKTAENPCQRLVAALKRLLFKQQEVYVNTSFVDKYIDKYWMLKCPDRLSVSEVNQQVYMLFHQMFILGNEYQTRMNAKMEEERTEKKKQHHRAASQEDCQKFKHRGMKFVKSSMVNEIQGKTYLHRRTKYSQQYHRRFKSTESMQLDYYDYTGQRGSGGHQQFYSPRYQTTRAKHRQRP